MPKKDKDYRTKGSSNPRDPDNRAKVSSGMNSLEDIYKTMTRDYRSQGEKDLQNAQVMSFLSGFPLIGGFIRGYQGARYMEDYYKNTGMLPNYPGLNDPYGGFSTLGRAVGNTALSVASNLGRGAVGYNVKEGTNDLLKFYNFAYQ